MAIHGRRKNIIKKGFREKALEKIRIYACHDCGKKFTGQRLKGKRTPPRIILDGISFYNLGYSYEESCRFLERRYGQKVDSKSLARWVEQFSDICTYGRIREYGMKLYTANQVIASSAGGFTSCKSETPATDTERPCSRKLQDVP